MQQYELDKITKTLQQCTSEITGTLTEVTSAIKEFLETKEQQQRSVQPLPAGAVRSQPTPNESAIKPAKPRQGAMDPQQPQNATNAPEANMVVKISSQGDTDFKEGMIVHKNAFKTINSQIEAIGGEPAKASPVEAV